MISIDSAFVRIWSQLHLEIKLYKDKIPDIDDAHPQIQEIILKLLKKFPHNLNQDNFYNSIVSKPNMHNDEISSFLEFLKKRILLGGTTGSLNLWSVDYVNSKFDNKVLIPEAHTGAITSLCYIMLLC